MAKAFWLRFWLVVLVVALTFAGLEFFRAEPWCGDEGHCMQADGEEGARAWAAFHDSAPYRGAFAGLSWLVSSGLLVFGSAFAARLLPRLQDRRARRHRAQQSYHLLDLTDL